jgi:hypothetical protein
VEWNWIESPAASTLKNDFLRGLVLDTEKITMKFDKHIVITYDPIDGKQTSANIRNVKNIFEIKRMHGTS